MLLRLFVFATERLTRGGWQGACSKVLVMTIHRFRTMTRQEKVR